MASTGPGGAGAAALGSLQYGAVAQGGLGRGARALGLDAQGPIFLENPDGTITEAVPSACSTEFSKKVNAGGELEGADNVDDELNTLYQDFECIYVRHERILVLVITLQLLLEILYGVVFVVRMEPSIMEFMAMYDWQVSHTTAMQVLWTLFWVEVAYSSVYYILVGTAIWTRRPKRFHDFAIWSLCGAIGLILLAYVDKFNLPIFFLRLFAYIYARFLQGLTSSLMLLPPMPAEETAPEAEPA
jgi:hypothetical protein